VSYTKFPRLTGGLFAGFVSNVGDSSICLVGTPHIMDVLQFAQPIKGGRGSGHSDCGTRKEILSCNVNACSFIGECSTEFFVTQRTYPQGSEGSTLVCIREVRVRITVLSSACRCLSHLFYTIAFTALHVRPRPFHSALFLVY
jgi:hypothetical protein